MDARGLERYRRRLYSRVPVIGERLRRGAAGVLARDGTPGAVRMLAEAVTRSDDGRVRGIALNALRRLASRGCVEAREALCRLVIVRDHPWARKVALAAQYAPLDPHQRALFYFLTGQWDRYERLDFDQTLLRVAYQVAGESLRRRITERARRAGRMDWVAVVTGGRQGRRLWEMMDEEWEAALAVLGGNEQWGEMWRLAQAAPEVWSVRLLQRLKRAAWVPSGDEREGFVELAGLAEGCIGDPPELGRLIYCRAVLRKHDDRVTCLAISPDGRLLATGTELCDDMVRLWRLPDGEALKAVEGHEDGVGCLAISPDGRLLASGGGEGMVWLWQLPGGRALSGPRRHANSVTGLAISPDGQVLASGSSDKMVRLWRLPDGEALKTLEGHTDSVRCLAISSDGRMLVSGGDDHAVWLWHLPDGAPLKVLRRHTSWVTCLAISPDGRLLVSGSADHTVRLWRLSDGAALRTLRGHTGGITCLAISPDGRLLASGSADHTVRLWRLPDGAALRTLRGHTSGVTCLVISPDGRVLASGSNDKTVRLWRLPDGISLKTLEGHVGSVWCLALSPDGRLLASGSGDKTVRLWELGPLLLRHLPLGQTCLGDMTWARAALRDGEVSETEQRWLEFVLALMRWRRRFDIEVAETPSRIQVGEFDIEVEG